MSRFVVKVNVIYQKDITVYADDEAEAEEKACDIVRGWQNVHDVEPQETTEA